MNYIEVISGNGYPTLIHWNKVQYIYSVTPTGGAVIVFGPDNFLTTETPVSEIRKQLEYWNQK